MREGDMRADHRLPQTDSSTTPEGTSFKERLPNDVFILYANRLTEAFKHPDVKVYTRFYYTNFVTLVVTPFDYFVIVISVSNREHCIPPSIARFYLRTQLSITEDLIYKWFGKFIKGKKCSGIFSIRVGNYSQSVTGFHVVRVDDNPYREADLIIRKDEDNLWLYIILERLEKWLFEREKGLLEYSRTKGIEVEKNKLLNIISRFKASIRGLKSSLKHELPSWNRVDPLHKAIVIAATSILGTLGVPRTLKNIEVVVKSIADALKVKERIEVGYILERTCKAVEINGEKEYIPPRRLKALAFRVLQNHIDKPVWFKNPYVKPIKVLDAVVDDVDYCLTVLLAHVFTKNGVIFENMGPIASIASYLLSKYKIPYDPYKFSDTLDNIKHPLLLLQPSVFKRVWQVVYFTFRRRRSS